MLAGQDAGCSQPSGVSTHDLNDGYSRCLIDRGIQADLTDSGGNIFGSTSITWCMVSQNQVVVNGFWDTDKTDGAVMFIGIPG